MGITVLVIALAVTVLPFLIGSWFCKRIRMPEYGWKVGVILCALAVGSLVSGAAYLNQAGLEIKRGIDLSGGVILIYQVDTDSTSRNKEGEVNEAEDEVDDEESQDFDIKALTAALARRINPGGVKEVVIRPYGDEQVEIIIPEVDNTEVEQIKNKIKQAGFLKFRIMADPVRHESLIKVAKRAANQNRVDVYDGARKVAEWVPVGFKLDDDGSRVLNDNGDPVLKVSVAGYETRERKGRTEVLMEVENPRFSVEGRHLKAVRSSFDEKLRPSVNFAMTPQGSTLLSRLTGKNQPDPTTGREMRLGIILDDELLSAPGLQERISSQGRITGDFTQEEVDLLVGVLKAGRLPAVLKPDPISQSQISPLLGEDTIRKGSLAIVGSLILVLIFMAIYYRFAGLVACFALVVNLVLILALMIGAQASFSLAGLAGLVLTVGMSVDANVLIFERMREELTKGAALRMAIRNGFSRATTTIVDANVTTFITAAVLYVIGTDQIRGFALTLMLGILMSMFTAIFCARVFFDIAERRRWITGVSMMHFLAAPDWNLFKKRSVAAMASGFLVLVSLGAIVIRGSEILDIDFRGGTSIQILLTKSTPIGDIRGMLAGIGDDAKETPRVTQINPEDQDAQTVYKVDSLMKRLESGKDEDGEDVVGLKDEVNKKLGAEGENLLETHILDFKEPGPPGAATTLRSNEVNGASLAMANPALSHVVFGQSEEGAAEQTEAEDAPDTDTAADDTETADTGDASTEDAVEEDAVEEDAVTEDAVTEDAVTEETTNEATADETADEAADAAVDDDVDTSTENATDDAATDASTDDAAANEAETTTDTDVTILEEPTDELVFLSQTRIDFDEVVSRETAIDLVKGTVESMGISMPTIDAALADGEGPNGKSWDVLLSSSPDEANEIFTALKQKYEGTPIWLSSSLIGAFVAGKTQWVAIMALLLSLVGIVAYIWFRFQHITFGLAAVVALVHDVILTLGAIAISVYLADIFGFLLIEEFKISLPIVAALLTIIGYSLNDTIVVFDRIREVRGKSPKLNEDMINTSINQTLSRTILTSLTTLIVVAILYIFGGEGIHGFAFALMIGVMVGTYSSIFVASPALLWMSKLGERSTADTSGKKKLAKVSA